MTFTPPTQPSPHFKLWKAVNGKSLGGTTVDETKTAVGTYKMACETFKADPQRWTSRSKDGKLSPRDRANVGFFKKGRIESVSKQLQSCKTTIDLIVGIATFIDDIPGDIEDTEIRANVLRQIEEEHKALSASRKLLDELRVKVQEDVLVKAAGEKQNRSTHLVFGNQNSGFQIGISNGPISGISFEARQVLALLRTAVQDNASERKCSARLKYLPQW
ncbi:hypothetical protein EMPG_12234 [Blastomyces silverae]|uniref:Uncharacterized protein n=1 Tax=Blastomyces silverae TaxID=2060906 RepID=A0A0H1BMK7_9EURO|nr:hypothetical protein EMPG_12234 [Blastomyces silverae]